MKNSKLYSKLYGLDTYGLNISTFWKRQNPDGPYAAVIPKFISMLMQEKDLQYGDGKQSRISPT